MARDVARSERAAEAAMLRAQGLLQRQIADRMGISRTYAAELLTDPDGSKVRARKATYGKPCRVCGKMTQGSDGRAAAPDICSVCLNVEREPEHGNPSRYHGKWRCRCPACTAANTARNVVRRHSGQPAPTHGVSGYTNYACRCEVCTRANTEYNWGYAYRFRMKKKARAA